MGRVVVVENVTLDGVMQAPGGAEEDLRADFPYGGWARPYADRVMAETMGRGMGRDGGMLFGRRTYEQFHGFWSNRTDGNPYTEVLNRKPKYVASRTLSGPLLWQNSSLLVGEAVDAVAGLKRDVAGDLVVLGSGELVRSLAGAGLVDVYTLSIHPLTLGIGTKLFGEGAYGTMELVEAVPTTTGVIIASYRPTA
ncbi:dihydrofolate reductase family protein [Micromonospora sp. NBC_01796]|uniref:dihydrofolate reductase family protein n=1 Tax=Micromonospora sp. NBC_01796 TaxID=2975987 RepID=UPI002DDC4AC9|nr:dihydrofolate reductase family protein [Micromonospora sp. NBC_01796]WSA85119.1 dihydrofolate reductase family protein [Micromonospora sp. NBC_01796]